MGLGCCTATGSLWSSVVGTCEGGSPRTKRCSRRGRNKAGERAGRKNVSLVIYRTAPTVIRIGDPQFVFGVGL
jgi:hypothetical protein